MHIVLSLHLVVSAMLGLIGGQGATILTPTVTAIIEAKSFTGVVVALEHMTQAEQIEAIKLLIDKAPDIIDAIKKSKPVLRYLIEQELKRRDTSWVTRIPTGPPMGMGGTFMGYRP